MANFFSALAGLKGPLALAAVLLLSGCCANNVCNCTDDDEDVVELRFASSFTPTDLDTVVIERYPIPLPTGAKPAVVTLIRAAARARDSIRLNNRTPFAQVGTTRLGAYRYVLRYYVAPPRGKSTLTTLLTIDSLKVNGNIEATGCCSCYTNTQKTVYTRRSGLAQDSVFDLKRTASVLKVTK